MEGCEKMFSKRLLSVFMCLLLVFLTGCWDKIEIDDRAFVLAMVVNTAEKMQATSPGKAEAGGLITADFYMPIPSKLLSTGGGVDAYSVEHSDGKNLPMAVENLNMKFSRQMFFGQTKIILVGEKALSDAKFLKELMDFIEREPDMGREAKIAVLKGDPKKLLSLKPKFEKVFASYMAGIFNNSERISSYLSLSINDFLSMIRENKGSVVLPVAEIGEDKVSIKQLALIKDYKLLNYMDEKYLKPYSLITNTLKDGNILVPYNNDIISLKVASATRKISLTSSGDNLEYKVGIKIEGDIDNYISNEEIFQNKSISSIKDTVQKSIKDELDKTTSYFQNDIGYDYLGFNDYTKKHHNKLYKEYENSWNDEFQKANINYDVQVFIRRLGGSRK